MNGAPALIPEVPLSTFMPRADIVREYAVAFMKAKHGASDKAARQAWMNMQTWTCPDSWSELEHASVHSLTMVTTGPDT
jgi:hypothetical protein